MDDKIRSITWEAYPHHHIERSSDWFWILGIVTLAITIASIVLGNVLFGILIFIAGLVSALQAMHPPQLVPFAVTSRGVQADDKIYPYATLESFYIDDEHRHGPQLFVKSERFFMPLIIIPLPEEYVDDIEDLVASRLPEEHLEEPFAHILLELVGF